MTEPVQLHLLGLRVGDLKHWCEVNQQPPPEVILAPAPLARPFSALRARHAVLADSPDHWRVARVHLLPGGGLSVVAVVPFLLSAAPSQGEEGELPC